MTTVGTNFNYSASEHGADGERMLGTTDHIKIKIDNARRERTGIHGRIMFFVNSSHIAFDNINLEKGDQRSRFVRDIVRNLSDAIVSIYSEKAITHDIGLLCQAVINWDMESLKVDYISATEFAPPIAFPLYPFLREGAGTILFAPPGTGKSWVSLIMGVCLSNGLTSPFNALKRHVIYANLERPRNTFLVRDHAVRRALGFPSDRPSGIGYIHARGLTFKSVLWHIEQEGRKHPDSVVILDSISRTGLGSLLDDTTANQFTDAMNALGLTWLGVGHTPRGDDKHIFGSVHFTAGCDIETRLVGSEYGHTLNLLLETVKANDSKRNFKHAISLEFGAEEQEGLVNIREIQTDDPGLVAQSTDNVFRIAHAIEVFGGKATPSEIAEETGIALPNVSKVLTGSRGKFVFLEEESRSAGRNKYYGVGHE